jgi:molybdenum cofactor cytidylyltransferase
MALAVVILGAGQSRRMGRPKLLLPWLGTTVIGYLLKQWRQIGALQIAVVCAAKDQLLQDELARLGFPQPNCIFNPTPERGMFSSIQCAAAWGGWNEALTHWAIVLGDQPQLPLNLLRELLKLSAAHPDKICQPRYDGHRRHPVLLPRATFLEIADTPAGDLKQFLDARFSATTYLESTDPSLAIDLDRPEDYERAVRTYAKAANL